MSLRQKLIVILLLCLMSYLGSSCSRPVETVPTPEEHSLTSISTPTFTQAAALLYSPELTSTATPQLTSTQIPSQTFTPVVEVSPTPTQPENIDLPVWVSDPKVDVLLAATGNFEDDVPELVLVNASSGEKTVLPQFDMVGYFWTEDGRQIGLLQSDGKHVVLINTLDGQVSTMEMDDGANRFAFVSSADSFPKPFFASGSDVSSTDFLLLNGYDAKSMSFDHQYFLVKDYQIDEAGIGVSVLNLETGETIPFSYPNDGLYEHDAAFSPNQPYLAVAQSDGLPFGFEFLPDTHASLKIYDLSRNGELISDYENVTLPDWSPDGSKFLYQPIRTADGQNTAVFLYSPPCAFDRLTGKTRCYNEVMTRHQPQHGQLTITSLEWLAQTTIGYIYYRIDTDLDINHESREVAGLCFIEVENGSERCILEKLEEPGQKIRGYEFSSSGNFVSFFYDTACPVCDEFSHPQLAVADPKTGKYVAVGDWHGSNGLWRPTIKP